MYHKGKFVTVVLIVCQWRTYVTTISHVNPRLHNHISWLGWAWTPRLLALGFVKEQTGVHLRLPHLHGWRSSIEICITVSNCTLAVIGTGRDETGSPFYYTSTTFKLETTPKVTARDRKRRNSYRSHINYSCMWSRIRMVPRCTSVSDCADNVKAVNSRQSESVRFQFHSTGAQSFPISWLRQRGVKTSEDRWRSCYCILLFLLLNMCFCYVYL